MIFHSITNYCNEAQWKVHIKYFWNENVSLLLEKYLDFEQSVKKYIKFKEMSADVWDRVKQETNRAICFRIFFSFSPDAMTELSMPCWHTSHPVIENNLS